MVVLGVRNEDELKNGFNLALCSVSSNKLVLVIILVRDVNGMVGSFSESESGYSNDNSE